MSAVITIMERSYTTPWTGMKSLHYCILCYTEIMQLYIFCSRRPGLGNTWHRWTITPLLSAPMLGVACSCLRKIMAWESHSVQPSRKVPRHWGTIHCTGLWTHWGQGSCLIYLCRVKLILPLRMSEMLTKCVFELNWDILIDKSCA